MHVVLILISLSAGLGLLVLVVIIYKLVNLLLLVAAHSSVLPAFHRLERLLLGKWFDISSCLIFCHHDWFVLWMQKKHIFLSYLALPDEVDTADPSFLMLLELVQPSLAFFIDSFLLLCFYPLLFLYFFIFYLLP